MPPAIDNIKEKRLETMAKIKLAESANLKDITTNKPYRRLTVKCTEMRANFDGINSEMVKLIKN